MVLLHNQIQKSLVLVCSHFQFLYPVFLVVERQHLLEVFGHIVEVPVHSRDIFKSFALVEEESGDDVAEVSGFLRVFSAWITHLLLDSWRLLPAALVRSEGLVTGRCRH